MHRYSRAPGRRRGRAAKRTWAAAALLVVIVVAGAVAAIGCGAPDSPQELSTASPASAGASPSASAQGGSSSSSPAVTGSGGASPSASATSAGDRPISQDPIDYNGTFFDPNGGGVTITGGAVDIYHIVVFSEDGKEYRFTGHMTDGGLVAVATESATTMTFMRYEDDIGLHVQTSTGYQSDLMP